MLNEPNIALGRYLEVRMQEPLFRDFLNMLDKRIEGLTCGVLSDKENAKLFERGEIAGMKYCRDLPGVLIKQVSTMQDT